jgi:hypothetical protein
MGQEKRKKSKKKKKHMHFSFAVIEALGKPRRLSLVAASANENKYNYSHLGAAFFKTVWGILEFLDRETRNCRPQSMLNYSQIYFTISYLHGTCLKLGSLEPLCDTMCDTWCDTTTVLNLVVLIRL